MYDYDSWRRGDYESYQGEDDDNLSRQDLIEVRHRFEEVIEMLCTSGELNTEYLDDCLGQISKILSVPYSANSPLVERLDVRYHLTPIK